MHISPVFIGHGSPMNAISNNAYTKFLSQYAQSIPIPKAIIVISAHWQTKGTYITGSSKPKQIYDFWGFPDQLYKTKYEPIGSTEIAETIHNENSEVNIDYDRGIDHAGWAVVKHLYPNQNIPLLEMSLDINKTEKDHFNLESILAKYSSDSVLFIGSGNIVHNLSDVTFDENAKPFVWAIEADRWIKNELQNSSMENLVDYKKHMPNYIQSIPTNEHYLPLLYILGMKTKNSRTKTIYEEIQNGSISMRSISIE